MLTVPIWDYHVPKVQIRNMLARRARMVQSSFNLILDFLSIIGDSIL